MRRRARLGVRASVTIRCASRLALRARTPRARFASARSSPMKASALSQVQRPRRRRPRDAAFVRLSMLTPTLAFASTFAWRHHAKQRARAPSALSTSRGSSADRQHSASAINTYTRSLLTRSILAQQARRARRAVRCARSQRPGAGPATADTAWSTWTAVDCSSMHSTLQLSALEVHRRARALE